MTRQVRLQAKINAIKIECDNDKERLRIKLFTLALRQFPNSPLQNIVKQVLKAI